MLNRLRKQKLFAKISKCAFVLPEIDYVGFRVGREGIKTQPEELKALKEWPTPQNVKDVQKFTGLTIFYQKFVPTRPQHYPHSLTFCVRTPGMALGKYSTT